MSPVHLPAAVVLIVEDEMLLRMRAVDMMENAGYTVVEAVDADEAVAAGADVEIPANSRFFGKPLEAKQLTASMRTLIGHA